MKAIQVRYIAVLALAVATASCTDSVRQGTGGSFLIVESLEAAEGGNTLRSDVITAGSVVNDLGVVTFGLGLKDPGRGTAPTQNLWITVDRYRVQYIRADGRNTPGVDVPYPLEGAITATVAGDGAEASFQIVRHLAKAEAPLGALRLSPVVISTIAEVTFYGRDQTGHEVSVIARMSIDFGDFADSQ